MLSMTGFGRAELKSKLGHITVEIAGVNNRFLEFSVRLPRPLTPLEPKIRDYLSARVSRGKVTVSVNFEEATDRPEQYRINEVALASYVAQLKKLQRKLKLSGNLAITDLVSLPDVVTVARTDIDPEQAWKSLERTLGKATRSFVSMREREGRAMAVDMAARLNSLTHLIQEIEKRTASSAKIYADKLNQRINDLLDGPARDQQRLEEEIAYFADRTDIAEECVRFKTHVSEYRKTLKQKQAVGRRLNFILQEMNREANTIGSKSADFDISALVISVKEEIEKLREMVQNAE
jgi:uncharacterized protein (TIGR00255 family)